MLRTQYWLLTLFTLLMIGCPTFTLADPPVADPGFAFVDVNGDGMYSASDGDIGLKSTPSVDIEALILSDGVFNTQISKGAYHAPGFNVSLVIPASRTLTLSVPLLLQAGENLLVYGSLSAPAIDLTTLTGNIDMTASMSAFTSAMNVGAFGNAILDGATLEGTGDDSSLSVITNGNISAKRISSSGFATSLITNGPILFCATKNISLDDAALISLGPTSTISASTMGTVQAIDDTKLIADGLITVRSSAANVNLQNSSVDGSPVTLRASKNIDVTGTGLNSAGTVTLLAGRTLTGNSTITAIDAAGIGISAPAGIDLSHSALVSSPAAITLTALSGPIRIGGASITSTGGLQAHAHSDIAAASLSAFIDHYLTLAADTGQIDTTNSTISAATSSVTDTYVNVTGAGSILASNANWTVPAAITLDSTAADITARGSAFRATGIGGTVSLLATGLLIDVRGTTFIGAVTFGPPGVNVIGP